jgi:hypothetical protein
MPVIDHEVHASVRHTDEKRYGCHNRPVYADGYIASPWAKAVYVPHVMSRECRYDRSLQDPWCADCKHRGSGEEYDRRIRELASVK